MTGCLIGDIPGWYIGNISSRRKGTDFLRVGQLVCCLQEVRLIRQGSRMMGFDGIRFRMWWFENLAGSMRVIVKEQLYKKVVKVSMVCDRVMVVVLIFEDEVLRLICGYAPHRGINL